MNRFGIPTAVRRWTRIVAALSMAAVLLPAASLITVAAQDRAGDTNVTPVDAQPSPDAEAASDPGRRDPYARSSTKKRSVLTVLLPAIGGAVAGGLIRGGKGATIGAAGGAILGGLLVFRRHRPRGPVYPKPYPQASPLQSE